jgi:hypothetical protein
VPKVVVVFGVGRSHFDWPITIFLKTSGNPPGEAQRWCFSGNTPPFYVHESSTFGQSMYNKSVALLGTSWGKHWELHGNSTEKFKNKNKNPSPFCVPPLSLFFLPL